MYVQLSTWLGIAALYLGFCMVMGFLVRSVRTRSDAIWPIALAVLHALGLFLPGTALVLGATNSSISLRLSVMLCGFALLVLAMEQPTWLPPTLFKASFLYRYFAAAMLFACAWGLSIALTSQALPALVIAVCAAGAGTASLTAPTRTA